MNNPTLRASDADRDRVVASLQQHVGAGRLTVDEFDHRAATAYHARTVGELADLTRDLPTSTPPMVTRTPPRGLPRLFMPMIAVAILAVLLGSVLFTPWLGSMAAACH
jgi:hypothetical protein